MKEFKHIDPPQDLETKILNKIYNERRKNTFIKTSFLGATSIASLFGLINVGVILWQSFVQTGFYEYLSLIFSDSSVLSTYWKEYTLSLIESLPLVGLISLLAIAIVFVWSSAKAVRNVQFMLQT